MENLDRAREIAGNPLTPADELEVLSQSKDALVRQNVAGNPNTSLETLWKLAIEFPEQVLENPVLPLLFLEILDPIAQIRRETLLKLFSCENCDLFYQLLLNSQHSEILLDVAKCARTHPSILRKLVRDRGENLALRHAIAGNSSTPAELLAQLASDSDTTVRCAVAKNASIPRSTLQQFAKDTNLDIRCAVAGNSSTPAELLAQLAAHSAPCIRDAVAANPSAPLNLLQQFATDSDTLLRYAVVQNPSTPLMLLQQLANDETFLVARAVSQHPKTLPETLHRLTGHKSWQVRLAVAENPKTLPETLHQLATDESESVRLAVAKSPKTLLETLRQLSRDAEIGVRRAVAYHPDISVDIVRALSNEWDIEIRIAVARHRFTTAAMLQRFVLEESNFTLLSYLIRIVTRKPNQVEERPVLVPENREVSAFAIIPHELLHNRGLRVCYAVVGNPNTSALTLEQLFLFDDDEIRMGIAGNPNTPLEILRQLFGNRVEWVRAAVAQNPNTPAEILQQLARDSFADVRYGVAQNPNTPVETLRDLARDKSYLGYSYRYDNLPVERFKAQRPYSIGFSKIRGWVDKGYVCGRVAKNPHAPTDALATLATDALDCLRYAVAMNRTTNRETLQQLADDCNPYIRAAAAERLS